MISLTHEEAVTLADLIGVYIRHAPPNRVEPAYTFSGALRRAGSFGIGTGDYRIMVDALRYASDLPGETPLRPICEKLLTLAGELN